MKHNVKISFELAKKQCSALDYNLQETHYEKIHIFMELLKQASGKLNLIGPAEENRLWERHVLESIAFIKFIPGNKIVDIGTGAGFPGLILALCGFDVKMVESRGKRCGFLETAVRICGVSAEVKHSRIEDVGLFPRDTVFTSRAVKEPAVMIKLITPVATEGFMLLTRTSSVDFFDNINGNFNKLPTPPLDRRGYILQYRHLKKNN